MGGAGELILVLVILAMSLGHVAFIGLALLSAARHEDDPHLKMLWMVAIFFAQTPAAIVYFLIRRSPMFADRPRALPGPAHRSPSPQQLPAVGSPSHDGGGPTRSIQPVSGQR